MTKRLALASTLIATLFVTQGCALLVGAGAVVATDEIVERERGGDGLF